MELAGPARLGPLDGLRGSEEHLPRPVSATLDGPGNASTQHHMADQTMYTADTNGGRSSTTNSATPQRSFSIGVDGSSHRGRHFFDATPAREEQWQQALAEEYVLEQHSLQDDQHLARHGSGSTARQTALQLATEAPTHHHVVWVVEDGSSKGTVSTKNGAQPSLGPGRSGVGSEGGNAGLQGFGGAVVVIEEPREADVFSWDAYIGSLPKKLKGGLDTKLPVPSLRNIFWSWLGAFLGILAVCVMNQWATPEIDIAFMVGSFGASAVLVFAVLESKMSQPRNFLGGQMLSALVGITTRVVIHKTWVTGPVGMSLALVAMQLTATTHPPGGATALIACSLTTLPKWHGYSYLVTIGVGSCTMQVIALVVNNIDPRRRYPTFWW